MNNVIMPPRIARLERDERGYPIPWNVLRGEGNAPIFTVNDDQKAWEALRRSLCPICGERLGKWKWWVGGPRSAFHEHGWYIDLAMHHECMQFALAVCPYLAAPKYLGRIDVAKPELVPAGTLLMLEELNTDRPQVFVAAAGDRIEYQERGLLQPFTRPWRPALAYEYWRHGHQISEEAALPHLRAMLGEEWTVPAVQV